MMDRDNSGTESKRLLWDQWHWNDHLGDPCLKACSMAAQGLWMRLLGIAAVATPRGYVLIGTRIPTIADLARTVGADPKQVRRCIEELERCGVFSRDERGVIFNRRMVQSSALRRTRHAAGVKGGNPVLLRDAQAPESDPEPAPIPRTTAAVGGQRRPMAGDGRQTGMPSPHVSNEMASDLVNHLDKPETETETETDRKKEKEDHRRHAHATPADTPLGDPVPIVLNDLANGPPFRTIDDASGAMTAAELTAAEDLALELWNRLAEANPRTIQRGTMTETRRKKLRVRLRQCGGIDGWQDVLDRVSNNPLWMGRVGKGWRPSFDDIVSETKFIKLWEGGYDQWSRPAQALPPRRMSQADASRESIMRRLGLLDTDRPDPGGPIVDMEVLG